MTNRYQVGRGWTRTGLMGAGARLEEALWTAIRNAVGAHNETRWRRAGSEKVTIAKDPLAAARGMIEFAKQRGGALVLEVLDSGGGRGEGQWIRLHKFTADPPSTSSIPLVARATTATRRTIRFHDELNLAIPGARNLGLYVPRPLKSDPSYWSEHAYAAADDKGADNRDGSGFSSDPAVLAAVLGDITRYTLANYRRLAVRDHIFNGRRWRRSDTGPAPASEPYGGSDRHNTHTHTAFADHDGRRPAWL